MKVYPNEVKEAVVKEYLKGNLGGQALAKKYGLSSNTLVYNWVHTYTLLGKEGFTLRRSPTKYTGEKKRTVLEFIETTGASVGEAAKKFQIPNPQLITKWQRKYRQEGRAAFFKTPERTKPVMPKKKTKPATKQTENQILLEEIERLRIENDYLKKLRLFQQSLEKKNEKFKPKLY